MTMTLGVCYDSRHPAPFREPWRTRHARLLEQMEWVDRNLAFRTSR